MSRKNERTQIEDCEPESFSVPSSPKKENGKLDQRWREALSSLSSLALALFCRVLEKRRSDFGSLKKRAFREILQ